jgi:hypothetical protein
MSYGAVAGNRRWGSLTPGRRGGILGTVRTRYRLLASRRAGWWAFAAILAFAAWVRLAGVFRGLDADYVSHPDEPKQVMALRDFIEGRYVRYLGNWFYDGYPYGLNHVDEWLLRPVLPLVQAGRSWVSPELDGSGPVPGRAALYYVARSLRVLYGLLVVLLVYATARQICLSRPAALWAMAAAAAAPLSVTVTHAATGDVGVDLFGMLGLLALARGARAGLWRRYSLLCGLCCGMAYACKYNGLLCLAAPLFCFALLFRADREARRLAVWILLLAAGFAVGVVALTPAFLTAFQQTWSDMAENLVRIRNHRVHPTVLALPFLQRARMGFAENGWDMLEALGWPLVLLSLTAAAAGLRDLIAARRTPAADPAAVHRAALCTALALYPAAAALVSLATKLRIQPFHLSYLAPPLVLAAALALDRFWTGSRRVFRIIAVCGALAAFWELAARTSGESFFWCREDNLRLARTFHQTMQSEAASFEPAAVRNIFLEDGGTAVFRNRDRNLLLYDGAFWNRAGLFPLPDVPYPAAGQWIFPEGPAFLRNDRCFVVFGEFEVERHVVVHAPPKPCVFGIRAGTVPANVQLRFGGTEARVRLAPNGQRTVAIVPRHWRESPAAPGTSPAWIVPLDVHAGPGTVTVTLLANAAEEARFRLFGGESASPADIAMPAVPDAEALPHLAAMRFLDSDGAPPAAIEAGSRRPLTASRPEGVFLPCGAYLFEADLRGLAAGTTVEARIEDATGCPDLTQQIGRFAVSTNQGTFAAAFSKPYAPYRGRLVLACTAGRAVMSRWSLRPDDARILADLRAWTNGGSRPDWLQRYGEAPTEAPPDAGFAVFDGAVAVGRTAGAQLAGRTLRLSLRAELHATGRRDLAQLALFVHLVDASGRQTASGGLPLWHALAASDAGWPLAFALDATPGSGPYEVRLGVWNVLSRKRLRPDVRSGDDPHRIAVARVSLP